MTRKGDYLSIEDYEVTEDGKVINKKSRKELKGQLNGKGYLRVSIGGKLMFVHRLVAEKFIPNTEEKKQVNHKDGNKLNNNVDNLEWVTNAENRKHAVENKLHMFGEKCSHSKLKKEDVVYIRKHIDMTVKELAEKFNVSKSTINDVIKKRTWNR